MKYINKGTIVMSKCYICGEEKEVVILNTNNINFYNIDGRSYIDKIEPIEICLCKECWSKYFSSEMFEFYRDFRCNVRGGKANDK